MPRGIILGPAQTDVDGRLVAVLGAAIRDDNQLVVVVVVADASVLLLLPSLITTLLSAQPLLLLLSSPPTTTNGSIISNDDRNNFISFGFSSALVTLSFLVNFIFNNTTATVTRTSSGWSDMVN